MTSLLAVDMTRRIVFCIFPYRSHIVGMEKLQASRLFQSVQVFINASRGLETFWSLWTFIHYPWKFLLTLKIYFHQWVRERFFLRCKEKYYHDLLGSKISTSKTAIVFEEITVNKQKHSPAEGRKRTQDHRAINKAIKVRFMDEYQHSTAKQLNDKPRPENNVKDGGYQL